MIFNGTEYAELRGDKNKYSVNLLAKGASIKLLFDDATPRVCGCRRMKKGNYTVTKVRKALSSDGMVYELVKNGAKYIFPINTIAIDKAIYAGVIEVNK